MARASEIAYKEKNNDEFAKRLLQKEYRFYCEVLRSDHCQQEYVRAMGEEFWEEQLEEAINAGSNIGKGFHEVRQEISYMMVSIYESLGSYSKAYDFLVEQAIGCSWLHLFTVQNIVTRVGYYDRLKSAVSISIDCCGKSALWAAVFPQSRLPKTGSLDCGSKGLIWAITLALPLL